MCTLFTVEHLPNQVAFPDAPGSRMRPMDMTDVTFGVVLEFLRRDREHLRVLELGVLSLAVPCGRKGPELLALLATMEGLRALCCYLDTAGEGWDNPWEYGGQLGGQGPGGLRGLRRLEFDAWGTSDGSLLHSPSWERLVVDLVGGAAASLRRLVLPPDFLPLPDAVEALVPRCEALRYLCCNLRDAATLAETGRDAVLPLLRELEVRCFTVENFPDVWVADCNAALLPGLESLRLDLIGIWFAHEIGAVNAARRLVAVVLSVAQTVVAVDVLMTENRFGTLDTGVAALLFAGLALLPRLRTVTGMINVGAVTQEASEWTRAIADLKRRRPDVCVDDIALEEL